VSNGRCGSTPPTTAHHDRDVRPAAGRNGSGYRLLIDRSRVRVPPGALRAPVAQLAEQSGPYRHDRGSVINHHERHALVPAAGRMRTVTGKSTRPDAGRSAGSSPARSARAP